MIAAAVVVIAAFVVLRMNQNKAKNDKRRYNDEGNTDLLITQINDPQDETKPRGSR
ncbi:MAG: hypothetical protein U0694_10885 [Anaerolineae bacterium]